MSSKPAANVASLTNLLALQWPDDKDKIFQALSEISNNPDKSWKKWGMQTCDEFEKRFFLTRDRENCGVSSYEVDRVVECMKKHAEKMYGPSHVHKPLCWVGQCPEKCALSSQFLASVEAINKCPISQARLVVMHERTNIPIQDTVNIVSRSIHTTNLSDPLNTMASLCKHWNVCSAESEFIVNMLMAIPMPGTIFPLTDEEIEERNRNRPEPEM